MNAPDHRTDLVLAAQDPAASALLVAEILGAEVARVGEEVAVPAAGITIRYRHHAGPIRPQRFTVLVDEDDFDAAYGRLLDRRLRVWADPERRRPAEIDHRNGGRALCFVNPDGHVVELATTPAAP